MSKRFVDTNIWNKKWFRELMPINKCALLYLLGKCDNVGVWDVDVEAAEFMIGEKINWDSLIKKSNGNIKILNEKKWYLIDFCSFQYGFLDENSKSPAIQSHIRLLKKHSLWVGYKKGIYTHKEKDNEKDNEEEKEKKHKYGEYSHVLLTDTEYQKIQEKTGDVKEWIKTLDEGIETYKYKYNNHYLVILKWFRKDNKGKDGDRNPHVKSLTCPDCGKVITGPFCRKCGWIQE